MADQQPMPRYMTIESCADLIGKKTKIVIVCGAGLSAGVAPLARAIEDGLWAAVTRLAHGDEAADLHGAVATGSEIRESYCTLELFVSGLRNRVPSLREPLVRLYEQLFRLQTPSRTHLALAKALAAKPKLAAGAPKTQAGEPVRCVAVLTSNFDDGLTQALHAIPHDYRLVTDANVAGINAKDDEGRSAEPDGTKSAVWMHPGIDVCAYHGTVDARRPMTEDVPPEGGRGHTPPTSMAARDLAHPFAPQMSAYVNRVLKAAATDPNGLILFVGHRGEDFYDLNLEIDSIVGKPNTIEERRRACKNVMCIPHRGRFYDVSDFYEKTFTKEGFVVLTGAGDEWLADLCDEVSGSPTTASGPPVAVGAGGVESRFLDLAGKVYDRDDDRRGVMAKQCRAFLSDIQSGVFAAWSVTEHYRLESLGYPDEQIAAFGRPAASRRFHGVPLAELITLQKTYKEVRTRIDRAIERHDGNAALGGCLDLMVRFEEFAKTALDAIRTIKSADPPARDGTEHLQVAMAALLAAIGYDYAGLIAMRCASVKHTLPDLSERVPKPWQPAYAANAKPPLKVLKRLGASGFTAGQTRRASDLFVASVMLANWAAAEIKAAARAVGLVDPKDLAEYEDRLAQIVAWEDWSLAPQENRLRLPIPEHAGPARKARIRRKRIATFRATIGRRIKRIEVAVATTGEKSFSAAADAAQCVQRLSESMRLVSDVKERGRPGPISDDGRKDFEDFVEEAERHARYCLAIDEANSSVRNYRFMAAYDALVLCALFRGEADAAGEWVSEAGSYAGPHLGGRADWSKRLSQVRSRVGLD